MINESFEKWIPLNNLCAAYDVENITLDKDLSFFLAADKKRLKKESVQRFRLLWDFADVVSYSVTDETYRADCWGLDFENDGRFYTAKSSDYIENFKQKSPLLPENTMHFLIIGTDTIVDVLAKAYPAVSVLE